MHVKTIKRSGNEYVYSAYSEYRFDLNDWEVQGESRAVKSFYTGDDSLFQWKLSRTKIETPPDVLNEYFRNKDLQDSMELSRTEKAKQLIKEQKERCEKLKIELSNSFYSTIGRSTEIEALLEGESSQSLSSSKYAWYFTNKAGIEAKDYYYKGDLENGLAIIYGGAYKLCGKFFGGRLNGYGKFEDIYKDQFDRKTTSLEGFFSDNKLEGLGTAKIILNNNVTEENSGYFKKGYFVVNKEFGGIDADGNLFLLTNGHSCKIYPTLLLPDFVPQGAFYQANSAYGIYVSFKPSIFGAKEINSINWTGDCLNGLASGNGLLGVNGVRDVGSFRVNLQPFSNIVIDGELENGRYKNCKVLEFNDWLEKLTVGSEAKKWIIFKDQLFESFDYSEINNAYKEYNQKIKDFSQQQNALADNYILTTSSSGIANVIVSENDEYSASISVLDGGIFSSKVSSEDYSTVVYDNNGSIIKSYDNPYDDNTIGGPRLEKNQLPGVVTVTYKDGNTKKTVSLKILKTGTYTLNIH